MLCAYPVQLLGEDSSVLWADYTGNTKQNLGALLKIPLNNFALGPWAFVSVLKFSSRLCYVAQILVNLNK